MKSFSVRLPAVGLNWQRTPQGLLKRRTLGMKLAREKPGRRDSAMLVRDKIVVRRQSEELDKVFGERQLLEHLCTLRIFPGRVTLVAKQLPHLFEFLRHQFAEKFPSDLAAIVQDSQGAADPVPDLRPRNFRGRGVFHQVEYRHTAGAGKPGAQVLDADIDVGAQAGLGDWPP